MLKMTRCSIFMYDFFSMISHAKNISIFTKIEMELLDFLSKTEVLVEVQGAKPPPPPKLMEFIHLQCSSTLKMTRFAHVYTP